MGKIELDHTGSGGGVTLSSDGTDLLLDGTAIGGGGGSPDLYAEDYDGTSTKPSVTGTNSVAIGTDATASSILSLALGPIATASGTTKNTAVGYATTATGSFASALGGAANANGQFALALNGGDADGNNATAINRSSSGSSAKAQANGAVAFGGSQASGTDSFAAGITNNTTSYGASGANSIAIGQLSKATAANSIAIGDTAISTTANQIALGGTTDTVKISGTYTLPTSDGTNGQVLTTDGSGAVTFADAGGGGASELNDLSDAVGNATTDNYGAGRDILGDITSGQENVAFGGLTGQQITTGSSNAFFGKSAGRFVTTGSYNVGIGLNAASGTNLDKQTGDYNIGIGWNAGNAVVSTDKNTAIGYNADNTGNPSGSTAIGSDAVAAGSQATALTDSYASGADSFAAAIANNTSNYGATGSNSVAIGRLAKATGSHSLAIGGYNNFAAGAAAVSIGGNQANKAFGNASFCIGGWQAWNEATDDNSFAMGEGAKSAVKGKLAYAGGRFNSIGDAQGGQFILRADTTDATATVLTTNNSTAGSTNQIVAASDTCITFDGTITAMQNGAQAYASWKIEGLLVNDGGTTTLANSATTVIQNLSSWGMALSADNTNNALAITVTGEAAHNIRWVANIRTTEVTYA
jgi:hypothetical protein